MRRFKIKCKILVYGFPAIKNVYIVDNYELKCISINEQKIKQRVRKDSFDTSMYISFCSFCLAEDGKSYVNYFENIDYIVIDVPDNKVNKEEIRKYIFQETNLNNQIAMLKLKLRLVLNIRILFPIIEINICDENNTIFDKMIQYREIPITHDIYNINRKLVEHNSHFELGINSLENLARCNEKFCRALDYFDSSFDSNSIPTRYLLLFSSMEALLGSRNSAKKNLVTSTLANRMSKILKYTTNKNVTKLYNRIITLYKIRSEYIHGSAKYKITQQNENELRQYVRKVLIIYWIYATVHKQADQFKIIKLIDKGFKLDALTQGITEYLKID